MAAGAAKPSAPPARILVVDDDLARAYALLRVLRGARYQVDHVSDGERCLAVLANFAPRLVLLDVVLPGMSGVQVCHAIKSQPASAQIQVLMVSSRRTTSEQQADGLEAGADGYLAWPFGGRELLARIEVALRHQPRPLPASVPLTPRQQQVVVLIVRGLTTVQIARELQISVRTAETHRAAAMRRLGLHSPAELVRFAVRHGIAF